jgi:hypothetical protein
MSDQEERLRHKANEEEQDDVEGHKHSASHHTPGRHTAGEDEEPRTDDSGDDFEAHLKKA